MVELERRGIPTVVFTAQHFVPDARRSAQSFGLSGLPLAVVPLPFTNPRPHDLHPIAPPASPPPPPPPAKSPPPPPGGRGPPPRPCRSSSRPSSAWRSRRCISGTRP